MSQPLHLFAEITRVDEEARIAEGYCRTSGRVKSDPYNLTLGALKRASADYLRWSNIREMHDPKAAGTCLALEFDEPNERIFIRAEIVDDDAWKKVKKGVYKGFSIGGRPTLLRGTEVVEFAWTETSLVDRPADPGAVITLFRRDDVPEEAEVERAGSPLPDYAAGDAGPNLPVAENLETPASRLVSSLHYDCGSKVCHGHKQQAAAMRCSAAATERMEVGCGEIVRCCDCAMPVTEGFQLPFDGDLKAPEYTPPTFEERVNSQERQAKASIAWATLRDVLFGIAWGNAENKEAEARAAIGQFADYVAPLIRGSTTERGELFAPFTRMEKPSLSTPAAVEAAPTASDAEDLDEMTATEITERLDKLAADNAALLARLDALAPNDTLTRLESATTALNETNEKLSRMETDLAAAKDEIRRIGDQPAGAPVVRFIQPLTREVVQRFGEGNVGTEHLKKLERYAELQSIAIPTDAMERQRLAEETLDLQRELKAAALI